MQPSNLLLKLVHIANEMQDEGADHTDTVYFPDHAALTLEELDRIIEALKDYERIDIAIDLC